MKIILLCIMIFILNANLYAQDLSVFDRHDGIIMRRALTIEFDELTGKFYYHKDDQTKLQLETADLFNIKGNDNCKYSLALKFYNPLRIKFDIEETKIEDPAIAEINSFLSKFPTEFLDLKISSEAFKSETVSLITSDGVENEGNGFNSMLFGLKDSEPSILITEWYYSFLKSVDTSGSGKNKDKYVALLKEINKLKLADSYLFGKVVYSNPDSVYKSVSDWIVQSRGELYKQVSKAKFDEKLAEAEKVLAALDNHKKTADAAINGFVNLITTQFTDKISVFLTKNSTEKGLKSVLSVSAGVNEAFRVYSASTAQTLLISINSRRSEMDGGIEKFRQYLAGLRKFSDSFDKNDFRLLQTSQIRRKEGIIKEILVTASQIAQPGENEEIKKETVKFKVSRWNSAYPFVSAGGLFTNFSVPEYSLSVDSAGAFIVDASEKKIRMNPSVFLNFVFNFHTDYLYPVLQVGISVAEKSFFVPVGVGFSISDRVTISGGFLPGFIKELDKLSVGENVSGEDVLEKDLSFKLTSSGYFAININLNK